MTTPLPLLTYSVFTDPAPLASSPDTGAPSYGSITIAVNNGGAAPVDCSSITFSIQVGDNAKDLTADATGVQAVVPTGWNVTQSGGRFLMQPPSPVSIAGSSLVFRLTGIQINDEPGQTPFAIVESASAGGGPLQVGKTSVMLQKFPAGFTLNGPNLNPTSVNAGGTVQVNWSGGTGNYDLSYNCGSNTVDVPNLPAVYTYTSQPLPGPQDTLFTLTVTVNVPGQDQPLVVQAQKGVPVLIPPPVVDSFTGAVRTEQIQLNWATEGAVSCAITGFSQRFNPSGPTAFFSPQVGAYTLTAYNQNAVASPSVTRQVQWGKIQKATLLPTIQGFSVSSDGTRAYVGGCDASTPPNNSLAVYDTTTWTVQQQVFNGEQPLFQTAVSTDGLSVYSVQQLRLARYDLALNLLAQTSLVGIGNIVPSPDGTLLYAQSMNSPGLMYLNANTLGQVQSVDVNGPIAVSPTGDRVYVVDYASRALRAYDAHSAAPLGVATGTVLIAPIVSPDGKTLYGASPTGAIVAIDTATLTQKASASYPIGIGSLARTGDGSRLFAVGYSRATSTSTLYVIDASTLASLQTIPLDNLGAFLVFSPAKARLYVASLVDNQWSWFVDVVGVSGVA